MYGVAILPFLDRLECQMLTKNWYACEGIVAYRFESLWIVLDKLNEQGGEYEYNISK